MKKRIDARASDDSLIKNSAFLPKAFSNGSRAVRSVGCRRFRAPALDGVSWAQGGETGSDGPSIRAVGRLIRVDSGAEGCEKELIAESVVDSKTLQFVLHGIFEFGKT